MYVLPMVINHPLLCIPATLYGHVITSHLLDDTRSVTKVVDFPIVSLIVAYNLLPFCKAYLIIKQRVQKPIEFVYFIYRVSVSGAPLTP